MSSQRQPWAALLGLGETVKRDVRSTQSNKGAQPALNRPRLRILKRSLRRLPNIERVCRHLDCDLIQFRSAGDPARFFIGRGFSRSDDSAGERATPRFRTLDSLEYFCGAQLDHYLALKAFPRRPRDWFWNKT